MEENASNEEPPSVFEKINILEDLDVRSAEVQEIIGRPPHWLVSSGITGFFGVLILIFLSSSLIEYPEVITAPLKLTAINEPKKLESRINGKLIKLQYENNVQVVEGQILAWLESTASHMAVLELSVQIDSMYQWLLQNNLRRIQTVLIDQFANLGELQTNFQSFEQSYREFNTFLPGGFYSKKLQMLQQEKKYTRKLLNNLEEQKKIQEINLKLAKQEYEAQKKLADKDLIAPIDLSKTEGNVAASRLPLQQIESAIINNYASQIAKEKELLELDRQIIEQTSIFRQALNTLKSAIDQREMDYLLKAPIDGKLVYAGIIQENQTLKAGQLIAYIQPENAHFFGELVISQNSFGKIQEGQRVLVRFSGYPYQEYGSVTGYIDYLSDFPVQDSVFLAKVSFPNGLTTNYGQELPPTNGMRGHAEIITKDMRLLERFYNNIAKQLR